MRVAYMLYLPKGGGEAIEPNHNTRYKEEWGNCSANRLDPCIKTEALEKDAFLPWTRAPLLLFMTQCPLILIERLDRRKNAAILPL